MITIVQQCEALCREGAFLEALALCPDVSGSKDVQLLKILTFANHKLERHVSAVYLLEQCLLIKPSDPQLHELLGNQLKLVRQQQPDGADLADFVAKNPTAFSSILMLAQIYETTGHYERALQHYLKALKTANGSGFWLNAASTAPWCRSMVSHAYDFTERGRIELSHSWLKPLYDIYGRDELRRVTQAIQMYTGEIPLEIADNRQKPSFLYIPGLPQEPVFRKEKLSFAEEYRSQYAVIKSELNELMADQSTFRPFQDDELGKQLTAGGDWDAFFFYRHGRGFVNNMAQCPQTRLAIDKLPLTRIRAHAPEVCFSILRANAHILPHRGVTNSRAVLHLGLSIPPDCALHLPDITQLQWREGDIFAFDDTYLHEAWNKSHGDRVVLLSDIWNPNLTTAECAALTILIETIGDFNQIVEPKLQTETN